MDREELWQKFDERIKENYEELEQHWLRDCYVPDILEDVEWIAAVKTIAENARSCVSNDAARQLLGIQKPLEALADIWVSHTDSTLLDMPDVIDREIDHDWLMDYEDYETEDNTSGMQME